jgi:hypothetical protein
VFSWKRLTSHNNFWIITKPKLKIQLIRLIPDQPLFYVLHTVLTNKYRKVCKDRAIPVQALSRKMRLPDFKTISA